MQNVINILKNELQNTFLADKDSIFLNIETIGSPETNRYLF